MRDRARPRGVDASAAPARELEGDDATSEVMSESQLAKLRGADIKAPIVGVSREDGRTRIVIGRGTRGGVRAGMDGYVVGDGGRPVARFVVHTAHPAVAAAYVDRPSEDVLRRTQVVLLASDDAREKDEGPADEEPAAAEADKGHDPNGRAHDQGQP